MSLLDSLVQYIGNRDGLRRSYSTDALMRCTDQPQPEDRKPKPLSRTMSRQSLVEKPDTINKLAKPLNRLFHIINKKLRTTRYIFFVKLQTLKKLNLKITKQDSQTKQTEPQPPTPTPTVLPQQPQPVTPGNPNPQPFERLISTLTLLYTKRFEIPHKELALKHIRKATDKRKRCLGLATEIERVVEGALKNMRLTGMEAVKARDQLVLKTEILVSTVSMFLREKNTAACTYALQQIHQRSLQMQIEQSQQQPGQLLQPLQPQYANTNETLTFSNLIENGDEYLDAKKSQHNLQLVIPAPISNIRVHEVIHMRAVRPLELESPSATWVSVKLEDQPEELALPNKREKMPRVLHKLLEDLLIQSVGDQGDSASMWLDSSEYSEQKSLTRNQSFINYLKQSDVKESTRELRPCASQNLLKPPTLNRHAQSSSSSKPITAGGGFDMLKRESLVEVFSGGKSSDLGYYEEHPVMESPVAEKLFSNPEERSRRLQFNTPKRLIERRTSDTKVPDAPSPIHDLFADRQFGDFTKPRLPQSSTSTSLFPSYLQTTKKQDNSNKLQGPKKTSQFYMQYLKSIRKTTQTATIKPRRELQIEPQPYYESSYYFGSKSQKNLGPNLSRS